MATLSDCTKCQEREPAAIRSLMGCAYLPRGEHVAPWHPSGWPFDEDLTVCPGHTVMLPEVTEVSRARRHWEKGELRSFTRSAPCDELMIGIEILDSSAALLEAHRAEERKKP